MRTRRQSAYFYAMAWLLGVVFVCSTASVSKAYVRVAAIQYTLDSNDVFYADGSSNGNLFLGENHTGNSMVVGVLKLEGDTNWNYEIRGGSITLTPSVLLEDQSYEFDPFLNPKIAQGIFQGGATFTISGYLTTVNGGRILSQYGTLIQATVMNNFYGEEEMWCPDFLDLQMQLNLTGGELFTGDQAGFVLDHTFTTDVTLRFCTEGGGELNDFTDDIGYAAPSVVQINPMPEPASLVLFGLAGLLIKKKK